VVLCDACMYLGSLGVAAKNFEMEDGTSPFGADPMNI
jgi:hypothetical protein